MSALTSDERPARAELFLPSAILGNCLALAVYRNTVGAGLADAQRVNHFPASPLVTVTRVFEGELRLIPKRQDWRAAHPGQVLPELGIFGPQPEPISSWSPGGIRAVTIGFYPDAWLALTGQEVTGQGVTGVPEQIARAFDGFAAGPEAGWDAACAALTPLWLAARNDAGALNGRISDWLRSFLTRMALSGTGRSLRALERRIKRNSLQTRQTLEFYGNIEELHRLSVENPDMAAADLALEAGFSDQSHMGRAVRRATGFSPAALNRMIAEEEPFWCYRLLGERY